MVIGNNMNNVITDIKKLEIETLNNLKNSKASNTLRAYESDYKDFSIFCAKNNFSSMPANPKILSLYLTYLSKTLKFSTLKRRIASICVIHKNKGHYIDSKNPVIVANLLGIKRVKGSHQQAKKPILISNLKDIIDVINKLKIKEIRKKRDKALILIGFAGGFRRSELVDLEREDVEFVREGVKIFVKKSKTDQSGEGMTKAIPSFDKSEYCPVTHLEDWMFNQINKKGKIFPISDKSVALIVKKYANLAGLDASKYAGHSLRSGFATSVAEAGAEERNIMAMTGHKTTQMVRRYIQEGNLFKNNALNKIKI